MKKDKSVNLGDKGCVNRAEPALPACGCWSFSLTAPGDCPQPSDHGGDIAITEPWPHPAAPWARSRFPPPTPDKTNPLNPNIPLQHKASSREAADVTHLPATPDGATNSLFTTYGWARVTY